MNNSVEEDDGSSYATALPPGQYYTLVIVAMVSSVLSVAGSTVVALAARHGISDSIYQRLVLGLSLSDAIGSFMNILHPFLLPRYVRDHGLLWASGNAATCSFIGFFFTLCPCLVSFFSLYLAAYFYLKVRHNTPDRKIVQSYEKPAVITALGLCLAVSVTGSATHAFAPRIYHNVCYFGDCAIGELVVVLDALNNTVVGECQEYESGLSWYLGWFQVALIVVPALTAVALTIGVYRTVHAKLKASQRFVFPGSQEEHERNASLGQDKKLLAVRTQTILYSLAYWNSFFWFLLYGILGGDDHVMVQHESDPFYFGLSVVVWTLFPLQGLINFLVYTRPRYLQWRSRYPSAGRLWVMGNCISFQPVPATVHVDSPGLSSSTSASKKSFKTAQTRGNDGEAVPQQQSQPESLFSPSEQCVGD